MFAAGDRQASLPFARSAMRQFGSIFDADKGNPAKARDYGQSANSAADKALKMNMLSEALSIIPDCRENDSAAGKQAGQRSGAAA